ncbi:MAG: ABC transporter permease subunit, partial [Campylobacter sp.]|nr:ABC transporter permease subunit [Campylobacter sp.]
GIFAGSYVVESVFSYPGIGELAISSVVSKDYPVVISVVLLSAVFVILSNLLAQIIAIMLDKRNL